MKISNFSLIGFDSVELNTREDISSELISGYSVFHLGISGIRTIINRSQEFVLTITLISLHPINNSHENKNL